MSRFKKRPIAAAVILMLSGTGPTLAQQQTLPEVKVTAPPEGQGFKTDTTNINRTEMPLRDIPQFINTVPEPLIRQQAITSLQEALRNVPGVTFTAAEGGVSASQIFWLRGFPAGGDLFLDSVRDIGEYNRDLFNIERVEVLKGPAALTFGRGSTGGVINQVSKIADLRPRSEAALVLGTNGELRATADANFVLAPTTALRFQVLGEKTDTYRDTDPERPDRFRAQPPVRHRHRPRHLAQLRVPADEDQDRLRPAQPRPDVQLSNAAGAAHAVLRLREVRLHELLHEHRDAQRQLEGERRGERPQRHALGELQARHGSLDRHAQRDHPRRRHRDRLDAVRPARRSRSPTTRRATTTTRCSSTRPTSPGRSPPARSSTR